MIQSMTPSERAKPELLNGSRKKRIALGSGSSISDVNQFLKQFENMRKMMKMMSNMGPGGMPSLGNMMKGR